MVSSSQNANDESKSFMFEADPLMAVIYDRCHRNNRNSPTQWQPQSQSQLRSQSAASLAHPGYFDLVLTSQIPLLGPQEDENGVKQHSCHNQACQEYEDFVQRLKATCFTPQDIEGPEPSIFFYDPRHLHVTLATLYPLEERKITPSLQDMLTSTCTSTSTQQDSRYISLQSHFIHLLKIAQSLPNWPFQKCDSSNIELELKSVQLGTKAGIFLWKDPSGKIAQIRQCLRDAEEMLIRRLHSQQQEHQQAEQDMDNECGEYKERKNENQNPNRCTDTIASIPDIIHTTFVRYARIPSNSNSIQKAFQSMIQMEKQKKEKEKEEKGSFIFSKSISITKLQLIKEGCPYMQEYSSTSESQSDDESIEDDGSTRTLYTISLSTI